MDRRQSRRSLIHLQMGQEIIYLVMAIAVISALLLAMYARAMNTERAKAAAMQREFELALKRVMSNKNEELEAAVQRIKELEVRVCPSCLQLIDQPPIITLSEAKGYYFELGSVALTDNFKLLLHEKVIPQLLTLSERYGTNVIEVIGHTDEVRVSGRSTSMDRDLLPYVNGSWFAEPAAADNVGLGMGRAAAVIRELRSDSRLERFTILPLSAGQTTDVDQELATGLNNRNTQERRRIEIRVRRK